MRLPFSLMACLRIAVCIIAVCSALTAQEYCFSGAVTSTQGDSALHLGDPVAVTIAIQPKTTSCTSNPYVKTCRGQITLRVQSGKQEWTTDPNDPQDGENNRVIAAFRGTPPLGGGTTSNGATTMTLVTGAHSGPGFGVAVHAGLEFPGDLLARNDFPIGFPSPEDIQANKGQFHIMVITNPGGWAELSYTGQQCARGDRCIPPCPGDIVVYQNPNKGTRGLQFIHVAVIAEDGVVRNADGTATITRVFSKWGDWGVYGHDPDDGYGKEWTVYHTTRGTNDLKELGLHEFVTDKDNDHPLSLVKPDNSRLTEAEVQDIVDCRCPGLYERLDKVPKFPPSSWPSFDCRGYVFAGSKVKINQFNDEWNGFMFGIDQTVEIINENGYRLVPTARHTGGHGCGQQKRLCTQPTK